MTTPLMADTPTEGEIPFSPEVEEDETSTDSPTDNNDTEKTPSAEGDDDTNTQQANEEGDEEGDEGDDAGDGDNDDDTGDGTGKTPFHEHPRWKKRETEWDERFNKQETRHQDDVKKLREEFGKTGKKPEDLDSKEAPSWFGGTPAQWKDFQKWNDGQIKAAEKIAEAKVTETKQAESKAVQDATDYFKSEVASIEADKTLNPSGKKVDPNKLLKVVMDNELIDSKGRWNYKAGIKLMNADASAKPVVPKDVNQKKKIAGATTSESRGESKPKTFKTTKDFQTNKPW